MTKTRTDGPTTWTEHPTTWAPNHGLSLWISNRAWNGGAWTYFCDGATDVDLYETSLNWPHTDVPWAVLGGLPREHAMVVPAGVIPDRSWMSTHCHTDLGGLTFEYLTAEAPVRMVDGEWEIVPQSPRPVCEACGRVSEGKAGAAAHAVRCRARRGSAHRVRADVGAV